SSAPSRFAARVYCESRLRPLRAAGKSRDFCPLSQRGCLVDAADEALQPKRQSTPLLLREETAQLALTAVRLDREPTRMQARFGVAKCNLRPMPREHDLGAMAAVARLDAHVGLGDGDRLAVEAAGGTHRERPAEEPGL